MKVVAPALFVVLLCVATLRVFTGTLQLTKTADARTAAMSELMSLGVALSDEIAGFEGDAAEKDERLRALLARLDATHRDGGSTDNGADVMVELPLTTLDPTAGTTYRGIVRFVGASIVGMRLVAEREGGP